MYLYDCVVACACAYLRCFFLVSWVLSFFNRDACTYMPACVRMRACADYIRVLWVLVEEGGRSQQTKRGSGQHQPRNDDVLPVRLPATHAQKAQSILSISKKKTEKKRFLTVKKGDRQRFLSLHWNNENTSLRYDIRLPKTASTDSKPSLRRGFGGNDYSLPSVQHTTGTAVFVPVETAKCRDDKLWKGLVPVAQTRQRSRRWSLNGLEGVCAQTKSWLMTWKRCRRV